MSQPQRKQKTQPKGKDKRTGKDAEPMDIPVPKRGRVNAVLRRASTGRPQK